MRPYNYRTGDRCRSHTLVSGTKLVAGFEDVPSPVRIIATDQDWAECAEHPQVERFEAADQAALERMLHQEMSTRLLAGGQGGYAPVEGLKPAPVLAAGPLPVEGLELAEPEPEPEPAPLPRPTPQFTPVPPAPKDPPKAPARRRR
jgi:hypothetical protein